LVGGDEEGDEVLFEVAVGQVSPGLMSQVALSAALCCISRVSVKLYVIILNFFLYIANKGTYWIYDAHHTTFARTGVGAIEEYWFCIFNGNIPNWKLLLR